MLYNVEIKTSYELLDSEQTGVKYGDIYVEETSREDGCVLLRLEIEADDIDTAESAVFEFLESGSTFKPEEEGGEGYDFLHLSTWGG